MRPSVRGHLLSTLGRGSRNGCIALSFRCVASLRMRDAVRIDMLSVEENERVYPKGA